MTPAGPGLLIVIGGASGIGQSIVGQAKQRGWRVVVIDRAAEPPDHSADEWCSVDICSPDAVRGVLDSIPARWGKAAAAILTAGITDPATALTISPDRAQEILDINVTAAITTIAPLSEVMADGSAVVLFSSVAAVRGGGFFGGSTYAASKAAVEGLTRGLARDLSPRGIRVNCVAPGPTKTPMLLAAPDDVLERVAHATLLNRLGEPDEVASVAMFLVGPEASFMTGSVVTVDGGASLK